MERALMESGVFPVSEEHTGDPVCACVQLWSPSSLSHGFLSLTSLFYPACRAENKVNKHGGVVGPPSFTPKQNSAPIKHPFISEQRRGGMGRRHGALTYEEQRVILDFKTRPPQTKQGKIRNTTPKTQRRVIHV